MEVLLIHSIAILMLLRGFEGLDGQLPPREPRSVKPYEVRNKSCFIPEKENYESSLNLCCSKCPPGSYRTAPCTRDRDTQCQQCGPGTHAEEWNLIEMCFSCRALCRTEMELVELQGCTARTKRRCACKPGTFCKREIGESETTCNDCAPQSSCPPGQGVAIPGNHSKDTVCERCKEGTFSNISSRTWRCQSHTNCSRLGRNVANPGNSKTDVECQLTEDSPEKREGDRITDSTSVSLAVISAILFLIVVATTVCLLQGRDKEEPIQLSCFKTVLKTCITDPEAQIADDNSREEVRPDLLLFPSSGTQQREAPAADRDITALESECLHGRASGPSPAANGSADQSDDSINESSRDASATPNCRAETGRGCGPRSTGLVGPVYIYNPSRVYVGVISGQRGSEKGLPARDATVARGSLRYPHQEAGTPEGERACFPEQEYGKESHLSESVSEHS